MRRFTSFRASYPYYLSEHSHPVSRRLHFLGSCGVLAFIVVAILRRDAAWLLGALLCGYGLAWIGHFIFEKNRPATFRHPVYSLMGDWMMFMDILRGRMKLQGGSRPGLGSHGRQERAVPFSIALARCQ